MVIFCMILRYREKSFNPAVGIETAFSNSVYFSKTYTMLQGFFFFFSGRTVYFNVKGVTDVSCMKITS